MSPYRETSAAEIMEVPVREGTCRLEVAPRHVILHLGPHIRFSVTEGFATLAGTNRRNRRKKRSYTLADARLVVARAVPTDDVGIWYEPKPGVATRLFGFRPLELLHSDGLKALRSLNQLALRLAEALAPHSRGVQKAMEIGGGADRVLITDYGDQLDFYVRRLFREWPRRALEVRSDGTITLREKRHFREATREFHCTSRFGVTLLGDHIRFADKTGLDLGSLAIPWITPEERREIADIIGRRIDPSAISPHP